MNKKRIKSEQFKRRLCESLVSDIDNNLSDIKDAVDYIEDKIDELTGDTNANDTTDEVVDVVGDEFDDEYLPDLADDFSMDELGKDDESVLESLRRRRRARLESIIKSRNRSRLERFLPIRRTAKKSKRINESKWLSPRQVRLVNEGKVINSNTVKKSTRRVESVARRRPLRRVESQYAKNLRSQLESVRIKRRLRKPLRRAESQYAKNLRSQLESVRIKRRLRKPYTKLESLRGTNKYIPELRRRVETVNKLLEGKYRTNKVAIKNKRTESKLASRNESGRVSKAKLATLSVCPACGSNQLNYKTDSCPVCNESLTKFRLIESLNELNVNEDNVTKITFDDQELMIDDKGFTSLSSDEVVSEVVDNTHQLVITSSDDEDNTIDISSGVAEDDNGELVAILVVDEPVTEVSSLLSETDEVEYNSLDGNNVELVFTPTNNADEQGEIDNEDIDAVVESVEGEPSDPITDEDLKDAGIDTEVLEVEPVTLTLTEIDGGQTMITSDLDNVGELVDVIAQILPEDILIEKQFTEDEEVPATESRKPLKSVKLHKITETKRIRVTKPSGKVVEALVKSSRKVRNLRTTRTGKVLESNNITEELDSEVITQEMINRKMSNFVKTTGRKGKMSKANFVTKGLAELESVVTPDNRLTLKKNLGLIWDFLNKSKSSSSTTPTTTLESKKLVKRNRNRK